MAGAAGGAAAGRRARGSSRGRRVRARKQRGGATAGRRKRRGGQGQGEAAGHLLHPHQKGRRACCRTLPPQALAPRRQWWRQEHLLWRRIPATTTTTTHKATPRAVDRHAPLFFTCFTASPSLCNACRGCRCCCCCRCCCACVRATMHARVLYLPVHGLSHTMLLYTYLWKPREGGACGCMGSSWGCSYTREGARGWLVVVGGRGAGGGAGMGWVGSGSLVPRTFCAAP